MLSFVAYFETLLQLSLHLCQFTCTLWNLGKKITFHHFSKKRLFSVFDHIEAQLSLENAWLPPVFYLDFNSPWYDLLVSHSHYLGKNIKHLKSQYAIPVSMDETGSYVSSLRTEAMRSNVHGRVMILAAILLIFLFVVLDQMKEQ